MLKITKNMFFMQILIPCVCVFAGFSMSIHTKEHSHPLIEALSSFSEAFCVRWYNKQPDREQCSYLYLVLDVLVIRDSVCSPLLWSLWSLVSTGTLILPLIKSLSVPVLFKWTNSCVSLMGALTSHASSKGAFWSGLVETVFPPSASHCIALCPVGISGISDGLVIRAGSFLGYQCHRVFLNIHILLNIKRCTVHCCVDCGEDFFNVNNEQWCVFKWQVRVMGRLSAGWTPQKRRSLCGPPWSKTQTTGLTQHYQSELTLHSGLSD